ncbi:MAG: hypothetical protein B6D55_04825, partial [Candidatus Omnitrophica bacterium 4484_70.2]
MKKIFIIGLTGEGKKGAYEKQLGNMAILIPMIKFLKKFLPEYDIVTTIQLTEDFCKNFGIKCFYIERKWPKFESLRIFICTAFDLCKVYLWYYIKKCFRVNFNFLLKGAKLEEFKEATLVLDFNGDIFPSDVKNPIRFLNQIAEIIILKKLGKTIIEFVSSPGPFKTFCSRVFSKIMYNNIDLILNREPISSELLNELGIKKPIINTACPAFLLKPVNENRVKEIFQKEEIDLNRKPLIGVTLCGYNLPSLRTWGKIKDFRDLRIYIPMIKYLLEELKAMVFLLPHVYRINPYISSLEYIHGPDYEILMNLYKMCKGEEYEGCLKIIEGKYNAAEAKGIIGYSDMFITGRLHAGVAALSQRIPTVLIAYGHKHKGIAKMCGVERYVY